MTSGGFGPLFRIIPKMNINELWYLMQFFFGIVCAYALITGFNK